jgi:hypothetical protein
VNLGSRPSLKAITDLLGAYLDEYNESLETVLLIKWADDLIIAAEATFKSAGITVSYFIEEQEITCHAIQLPSHTTAAVKKCLKQSAVHNLEPLSNSIDPVH